jgi:hypothetical protein
MHSRSIVCWIPLCFSTEITCFAKQQEAYQIASSKQQTALVFKLIA